jgi:protein Mpv17
MGVLRFGSLWGIFPPNGDGKKKKKGRNSKRRNSSSSSSDSINLGREEFRFPYKQAATAASLTLTGDTLAQFRDKLSGWRKRSDDAESDGKVVFDNFC